MNPIMRVSKKTKRFLQNESRNKSGYSEPAHRNGCRLFQEALEENDERRIKRLITSRCNSVFLALIEEAHGRIKRIIHTRIIQDMERVALKAFFTKEADELLDDKLYKLAECRDSKKRSRMSPNKLFSLYSACNSLC